MSVRLKDPGRRPSRRARRVLAVAGLALCLAGAHLAGAIHRVEHAHWLKPAPAAPAAVQGPRATDHDCGADGHGHGHPFGSRHAHGQARASAAGPAPAWFAPHSPHERDAGHDCAAFDAMALADASPVSAAAPADPGQPRASAAPVEATPRAIARAAYRSRAPPHG
jgi:hypothetical protein